MKLSTFNFQPRKTQPFLTTLSTLNQQKLVQSIIIDHNASLVGIMAESGFIIKFVKARSWHEYLKLLWNHSRITKEVKGCCLLQNIGLNVPQIHEVGYGIIPSSKYQFLGYYIMENLTHSGFQELSKIIKDNSVSNKMRLAIMKSIYEGLKLMRDNRIVFSDFHLDNIFANTVGEITWIDTGVTTYNTFNTSKFFRKYNHSIKRYVNYEYNGEQLLSQEEKAMFTKLLIPTP
jgi:tRNA A-37 threonylcarbamoyl transferase component Bud32